MQTTVQDLGRPLHLRQGIPGGGAMDRVACRVANMLVGNDDGAAVIEATLMGPAIEFAADTLIAICGGNLEPSIEGTSIPLWHSVLAPSGTTLRFGRASLGCRAYVAFAGGIDVPIVFGSRATYLRAEFGGYEGRALRAGDTLPLGEPNVMARQIASSFAGDAHTFRVAKWSAGATLRPPYADVAPVRLMEGAHTSLLTADSRERLFTGRFRVSSSSDRMGYRLSGEALSLTKPIELLSEAVTFGTMQLPPGGEPIVLMADAQTTGGYPRIGEVASVDLPLIAQLKPGDFVRFRPISLADAQALYLAQEAELAQARLGLEWRFTRGTRGTA